MLGRKARTQDEAERTVCTQQIQFRSRLVVVSCDAFHCIRCSVAGKSRTPKVFPRRSGISGHPGSGAGAHGRWDSALLHSRALGSCCAKTCQGTRHVSCQRVANSCWPQCATHLRRLAHRTSSTHPLSCVRRDREVVLAAVKKRGSALQYASSASSRLGWATGGSRGCHDRIAYWSWPQVP